MSTEEEKAMAQALETQRIAKKKLVLEVITAQCTDPNQQFEDLRSIGKAIKAGDKLTAKALSGGKTNFSFKVFLEKSPDEALFSKCCFDYALWNPDPTAFYDLKRTDNEFEIMKSFTEMMGGPDKAPVATPYLCLDVADSGRNCKILVTQWSPADEQWANQFIDGVVDRRVIPKLAVAMATLNCSPVEDPDYNDNVRPCMLSMFPVMKGAFAQFIEGAENAAPGDFAAKCKELGLAKCVEMMDNAVDEYNQKVEISHSDTAVFNILVEKKPSPDKLQNFGEKGSFVLCDWEMSFCGPTGRDIGIVQGFPLSAALCHAVQGHKAEAYDIVDCMLELWKVWAETMVEKGKKDEDYLRRAFRNAMGWTSFYMVLAYYIMGLDNEYLPLEGVPESDANKAKNAMGVAGLKFMEYGFGGLEPDLSLKELLGRYKSVVHGHFEELLTVTEGRRIRPRRASVLRETGRRVSDAGRMEEAARRLSSMTLTRGALHVSDILEGDEE